jgi:predicted  nucleic acid-binding Zn-ribbon protein
LKEQLRLLEELQRHDARLQELEAARKAIPEKLDAMRRDLAMIEDLLGKERSELEEAERWRRDKEGEMKVEESQLTKAKQKLSAVKNSKEYMATQREVETLRKMTAETEEKLVQFVDAADKARQKIVAHQADVEKLRELVNREERGARDQLGSLDSEIVRLRTERDAASKAVRPDVLKKYNTIKMRRGTAIAAVHNGTCRGCNMNIPPQLYNQLQRANAIELCPTCHRIIYWDKLLEDPDGHPSDQAEAEKPA